MAAYEYCRCCICCRIVRSNKNEILCNVCLCWIRVKCVRLSQAEFDSLSIWWPFVLRSLLQSSFPLTGIANDAAFTLTSTGSAISSFQLFSQLFNPFPYDDKRCNINYMAIDPDTNYCNNLSLPESNYVTSDILNSLRKNYIGLNYFSIFHVNCRSIVNNYHNLATTTLITSCVSVIAVSEL